MRRIAFIVAGAVLAAACTATSPPQAQPTSRSPSPSPSETPERVVIAVKGDWGAGTRAQRQVTRRMCKMREIEGFSIVMTTGDNFYPGGRARDETYTRPERCLYEHPDHVWRATWGNHDGANSTAELLGSPERYYRWSAGGADFFALDSNDPTDPAQRVWLSEQLAASTAAVKIVYFHHPPFTSGSVHRGAPAVRNLWVPVFEQHDVRLVLAGHNHIYERLRVNDIDYVTTGGGGQVLYRCSEDREPALVRCVSEHHFVLVAIEGSAVEVRAIAIDGAIIDRFVVS